MKAKIQNWQAVLGRRNTLITVIVLFGLIGLLLLFVAHATNPSTNLEAENGNLSGTASIVNDSNASGGKAVQFNQPGTGYHVVDGPLRLCTNKDTNCNPHFFTDNSGQAVYLNGYETQDNMIDTGYGVNPPPPFDWTGYINKLAANHMNTIRLFTWENPFESNSQNSHTYRNPMPYQRTGPGNAADGPLKFDLTKFNQAYFDRLRQRVIEAGQKNIYVQIELFQGFSSNDNGSRTAPRSAWAYDYYNKTNNINGINGDPNNTGEGARVNTLPLASDSSTTQAAITAINNFQKAYIKKVIDTVDDQDNVMYEICNECQIIPAVNSSLAWQNAMVDYIHSYEATKPKQHPAGIVPFHDFDNADLDTSHADWIGYTTKTGCTCEAYVSNPPISTGKKIILLDSDHVNAGLFTTNPTIGRQWVWKTLLRGMNAELLEFQSTPSESTAGWPEIEKTMKDVQSYVAKLNLALTLPSTTICSCTYDTSSATQYLIYQPNGSNSFTVDIAAAGTYNYEWFDTIGHKLNSSGNMTLTAGSNTLHPPIAEAVLYLKKQ